MDLAVYLEPLYYIIPELVVLGFCIKYYRRTRSSNALYMIIAFVLIIVENITSPLSFLLLVEYDMDPILAGLYSGVFRLLGTVGAFLFAFSLRNFLRKFIKLLAKRNTETIDHIGHS